MTNQSQTFDTLVSGVSTMRAQIEPTMRQLADAALTIALPRDAHLAFVRASRGVIAPLLAEFRRMTSAMSDTDNQLAALERALTSDGGIDA